MDHVLQTKKNKENAMSSVLWKGYNGYVKYCKRVYGVRVQWNMRLPLSHIMVTVINGRNEETWKWTNEIDSCNGYWECDLCLYL